VEYQLREAARGSRKGAENRVTLDEIVKINIQG
jgi:hypothetical protein